MRLAPAEPPPILPRIARRPPNRLAVSVALLCAALAAAALTPAEPVPAAAAGGGLKPKLTDLRCLSECAGLRAAGVGGKVVLSGRHLATVDEVSFDGDPADIPVPPDSTDRRRVVAEVPTGAISGRPKVSTAADAEDASPKRLVVADAGDIPPDGRLELTSARVRPKRAFFDQPGEIKLRYRFAASGRTGVRVEVVRKQGRKTAKTWREQGQLPYTRHKRAWNGLEGDGDVADDGAYRFRVGAFGRRSFAAGSLKLFSYRFPVRGSHGYGGYLQSFGAPRSGGRRHQGQDVYAACGTPLEAARGGRVQAKAYDSALYGHYVVIDVRKSHADHMYAHMPSPSRFGRGARVHTGERIGAVGKTGNARTTPCHLHFEIWPSGWRKGSPVDPKPALRRWDGWS